MEQEKLSWLYMRQRPSLYLRSASVAKQAFESGRRQLGIAHCVLDQFVAEIGLDRASIDAVVGQFAAHTHGAAYADAPARSSIAWKPRLVNGALRTPGCRS